jgi:hypothetical protein
MARAHAVPVEQRVRRSSKKPFAIMILTLLGNTSMMGIMWFHSVIICDKVATSRVFIYAMSYMTGVVVPALLNGRE